MHDIWRRWVQVKQREEHQAYRVLAPMVARRRWLEARLLSIAKEIDHTEQECMQQEGMQWHILRYQYLEELEEAYDGLTLEVARLTECIAAQQRQIQSCRVERKTRELLAQKKCKK